MSTVQLVALRWTLIRINFIVKSAQFSEHNTKNCLKIPFR